MTALSILRIDAAMRGNKTIYWMGRIPLIKRLVSDTLYQAKEGKMALSLLLWAWRAFRTLFITVLYVGIMCVVPLFVQISPSELSKGFGGFCWLLFCLSFVCGALLNPCSVTASHLKYTCVRMMSMNARTFHIWATLKGMVEYFFTFGITLTITTALMGHGALPGLLLTAELICARLIFDALHVLAYDKLKKPLYGRVWFTLTVILGGLAVAYIPIFVWELNTHLWLLSAPALIAFPVLAILSAVLLLRYPRWYRLTVDTCAAEKISPELAQNKNPSAAFRDVQLKDSDLTDGSDYADLSGWPYLQALFFRRHSRMMYKPVKYIMVGIGAVTVIGCVLLLIFRSVPDVSAVFSNITAVLPFCVFSLYLIESNIIGNRICKAMFYNCDLAMLKFGWYRHPKVILRNFVLRFRRVCGVNLIMSAALCVMFTAMVLCAGAHPPIKEYIAFMVALLALSVFFSVHSLGMYYLFQPYTSDLKIKNPFFGVINWIMYAICYACIQIRSTPTWFTPVVLAVTVLYSAVILFFVWRRAPKSFRVK